MPDVHIVVPVYNHYDLTHALLGSLLRLEKNNITSITVVDDCSTEEQAKGGMKWWTELKDLPFQLYCNHLPENVGFLRASNDGISGIVGLDGTKPDDIIILLSNDVLIHAPFILQIVGQLHMNPKSLIGGVVYNGDTGWNRFGDRIFPYAEGWLLATTAHGWADLDYFDEMYAPSDFEDVHLSTMAIAKGYELVALNHPGIKHLGGRSYGYNLERSTRTERNRKLFGEKWVR